VVASDYSLAVDEHDVWRHGGLGRSAKVVWSAAKPTRWHTVKDLHEATGVPHGTIRGALKKLARYGLVERGDRLNWRSMDRDLDEVAELLGVAGKGEKQRARHLAERAAHKKAMREGQIEWHERRKAAVAVISDHEAQPPIGVDPETGEIRQRAS